MNTDSFFRKGYSHQICEDYALNENQNLFTFIVSDGCSNSKHTDIGSRLLSWSAKEVISSVGEEIINLSPSRIGKMIIDKAFISVKNLNIPIRSLDATLLLGFYNKNDNKVHVLIFGDGAIFFKNKNEDFDYKIFEYSKNYPFYLSYLLYSDGLDKFNEKEQKKIIKTKNSEKECDSLYFSKYSFDVECLEWLFISTDGVESVFNTKDFDKIEEEKLYNELTSFKNYNGEFIKRRMKRAFKNLNKEDFDSEDDFSIAGINIQ
tara:strand:+ start:11677 stop:12462 length:786 start_codon:yes stop_codon:yes gene_type:complete